jgi:N-acetylneuraminic acid mutarotase
MHTLVTLLLLTGSAQASWRQVTAAAPWSARSDPQLALFKGKLLLFGGHANNDYYNDVWSSADGGATWKQLPAAPWKARSYHTSKVFGDELFLVGGHDNSTFFNDVWKTSDGLTWHQVSEHAEWCPRAATALQVRENKMFIMGGSTGLLKVSRLQVTQLVQVHTLTDCRLFTVCTSRLAMGR